MIKISILYYSKTNFTKKVAEIIMQAIQEEGIEAKMFSINELDDTADKFLNESQAIFFGTPVYYGGVCWEMEKWFQQSHRYNFTGKIGAGFVTFQHASGCCDAVTNLVKLILIKGMLAYSGGAVGEEPYVHMGLMARNNNFNEEVSIYRTFAKNVAQETLSLFQ